MAIQEGSKKRRRRIRVFPAVLIILLIGIGIFAYTQRDNLRAFVMSVRYSDEQLIALQEQAMLDLLDQFGLDAETVKKSVEGENLSEGGQSTPGGSDTSSATSDPDEASASDPGDGKASGSESGGRKTQEQLPSADKMPKDVQKLVYSLYSLQSQYFGQIDGIRASALARFNALPDEEKTSSKQISIAKSALSQALSLEKQCDGRVASLISEMRAALKANGMDESLAESVEAYYTTQKGLVKAEYMRKYNKYLK